jgi:hypothetical protein
MRSLLARAAAPDQPATRTALDSIAPCAEEPAPVRPVSSYGDRGRNLSDPVESSQDAEDLDEDFVLANRTPLVLYLDRPGTPDGNNLTFSKAPRQMTVVESASSLRAHYVPVD